MDSLTLFGFFSVTAIMICNALESRSHWFVLAFAGTCELASTYGFLQGAWPFGSLVACGTAALVDRIAQVLSLYKTRCARLTLTIVGRLTKR
jgi:hypothetical protein